MSSPHADFGSGLALVPGFRIGEYTVVRVLGKGGFGITYLAQDVGLHADVAIKELLPDGIATRDSNSTVVPHDRHAQDFDWARQRFREEARLLARLNHPNIVRVLRLLQANGTACMVMEYVTGCSLADWMRSHPSPTEQEVLQILWPLMDGLEYVHGQNLLHRDISPENIILRPNGLPVLLDFGSARTQGEKTVAMTAVIRHGYSPFEQYQTQARQGPATDIYALSSVMTHWMTGEKPPSAPDRMGMAEPPQEMERRLGSQASIPFIRALERGRAQRYTDRPQTMAEWRQMFAAPVRRSERHPSQAQPQTLLDPRPPSTRRPEPVPGSSRVPVPPTQPVLPSTKYQPVPAQKKAPALLVAGGVLAALAFLVSMGWLLMGGTPGQEDYDAGERHWRRGEYAEAATAYQRAVEHNPGYAAAWWHRGQATFEANATEDQAVDTQAVSYLDKAAELDPKLAGPLISKARVLAIRKRRDADLEVARGLVDKARTLDPSSYELDMILYLTTKGEEARNAANAALVRLGRDDVAKEASAHLWLERARCANFAKEQHEAMEAVDKALEINPDFPRAHVYRGVLHYQANRLTEARASFATAISKKPDLLVAYDNRVELAFTDGDTALAGQDLEEMLRLNPGRGQTYVKRGRLKRAKGDAAGARQDYTTCILKLPELADPYDLRADTYFTEQLWGPAVTDYLLAIKYGGETALRYADLGAARGNNGQIELALEDCEKALELDPTLGYTHTVRAIYLNRLQRYSEALVECEAAEKLIEHVAERLRKQMKHVHAQTLRHVGRVAEAEAMEEQINAAAPAAK